MSAQRKTYTDEEQERMDDQARINSVLRDVEERIGQPFGLTIAARSELCADELLTIGDERAVRYMVVSGWARELSHQFSRDKRLAKKTLQAVVDGSESPAEAIHRQLRFPVIAPNRPPVPLARATHLVIAEALDSEYQQVKGRQRNITLLERAARATAKWPNTTVEELIAKRLIRLEDLLPLEKTG